MRVVKRYENEKDAKEAMKKLPKESMPEVVKDRSMKDVMYCVVIHSLNADIDEAKSILEEKD